MLCTVESVISKSLPIFLWGTLFLNISIIFSRICWQTGDPQPIFAPKGLDLSWMLLLYQIIITITCWHQLFQNTSLFNQFTSLLALNCSCPNFFWNVLQVWMTGKDVYLQMTWSWPDKTWNILCSYCLQWNTSQSKFRNHYFLFLFAFSILSQLFLIWVHNRNVHLHNWGQCDTHLYVQPTIRYIQDTYVWSSYRCGAIPITVQCESISIRFNTMWFNAIQCNGEKKNMLFNSIWYTGLQTATKTVLKRKNINLRVKILLKSPLATIYMYMLWLKNLHVMPFFLIVLLSHLLLCSRIKLRRCASKF